MRGKASDFQIAAFVKRITPAYAGKRRYKAVFQTVSRDHPRLCGEKITAPTTQKDQSGSPPPMRGKATGTPDFQQYSGITPAYAGKSQMMIRCTRLFRDHPRLCGEKYADREPPTTAMGSPPPMRGKGSGTAVSRRSFRITPAYAGKRFGNSGFTTFF